MISVLCQQEREGWINPALAKSLLETVARSYTQGRAITVDFAFGMRPVELARNTAVERFLKSSCQWLVQADCDQSPTFQILDLIQAAEAGGKFIVGAPTPLMTHEGLAWNAASKVEDATRCRFYKTLPAGWFQPDYIGAGFIAVRRAVFETLKAPWFAFERDLSEDFNFCRKARAAGFAVWAHSVFVASHMKTVDLLDLMQR